MAGIRARPLGTSSDVPGSRLHVHDQQGGVFAGATVQGIDASCLDPGVDLSVDTTASIMPQLRGVANRSLCFPAATRCNNLPGNAMLRIVPFAKDAGHTGPEFLKLADETHRS